MIRTQILKKVIITTGLIVIWNIAQAQKNDLTADDFGMKASVHVKKLCEFGERSAGSKAEKQTVDYLVEEFKLNGMNVKIDTIKYRYYHLNNREIYINNCKLPIKTAFIDSPINDTIKFESYCIKLINNKEIDEIFNKVIITSASINSIRLNKYKPKAVIVIDQNIFDTIRINETEKYSLAADLAEEVIVFLNCFLETLMPSSDFDANLLRKV